MSGSNVDIEEAKARFLNQLEGAGPFGTWMAPDLDELRRGFCRVTSRMRPEMMRSGGTVAGPILMGLFAGGDEEPVCHVTGSYALPSRRRS